MNDMRKLMEMVEEGIARPELNVVHTRAELEAAYQQMISICDAQETTIEMLKERITDLEDQLYEANYGADLNEDGWRHERERLKVDNKPVKLDPKVEKQLDLRCRQVNGLINTAGDEREKLAKEVLRDIASTQGITVEIK